MRYMFFGLTHMKNGLADCEMQEKMEGENDYDQTEYF